MSLREVRTRSSTAKELSSPADLTIESTEDEWWYETLYHLVADLAAFADIEDATSLLASARDRLARSRTIERRSIDDHEDEWDEAIFFLSESETYGLLEIEPIIGLGPRAHLPLRRHDRLPELQPRRSPFPCSTLSSSPFT